MTPLQQKPALVPACALLDLRQIEELHELLKMLGNNDQIFLGNTVLFFDDDNVDFCQEDRDIQPQRQPGESDPGGSLLPPKWFRAPRGNASVLQLNSITPSQQFYAGLLVPTHANNSMADPLSITASLLAVITAAVTSVNTLYGTVQRFKGRDKTLGRLQNELQDITAILDSLLQVVDGEASMAALLKGPIERCSKVCEDFAQSMEAFGNKSKAGIRDWAKLEFMRGDINDFIDTLSGYKSTISVGLGTINIKNAKVSQQVVQEYNEMIQDTVYNLEIHLQRVDEKMSRYTVDRSTVLSLSANLNDEKEVTKLCLRICEDARSYLETLISRESRVIQESRTSTENNEEFRFEAQLITRQTFNEHQDSFARIIAQLRNRLETLVLKNEPGDEKERSRLLEDIATSKQCLEVCQVASEVSSQKIYRIGEIIAEGDSDQVVVTTLADLFDIKKASSKGASAQLVGSMGEESFQHVVEKRYSSRFGAVVQKPGASEVVTNNGTTGVQINGDKNEASTVMGATVDETSKPPKFYRGSSSNEVRKRMSREGQQ